MQRLGFTRPGHIYSDAVAVSRDGSIIAGNSRYVDNEAFVWDAEIGMTTLPPLPGTPVGYTYAFGMNANGTVVVGQSGIGSRAAYWRNGEVFDLGKYDWARSARAVGASDDGSVIVGYNSGVPGTVATVWTPTGGMQRLHDYLAAQGVVVPAGWSLYNCTGVSADGLTFVGSAVTATATAAYVVTIPTPGSMLLLGLGLTTMRFRRLVHK
jgi:uncharacterized membrane protein